MEVVDVQTKIFYNVMNVAVPIFALVAALILAVVAFVVVKQDCTTAKPPVCKRSMVFWVLLGLAALSVIGGLIGFTQVSKTSK